MSHFIAEMLAQDGPIFMGIVNLTPDSFSDGNPDHTLKDFLNRAFQLVEDGAHIIDVGGESTRPHADPVGVEEELERVLPFLRAFRRVHPDFPLSLDTKKHEVARQAIDFGVHVLNDVSFLSDIHFLKLARDNDCYYVLMHARGDSKSMATLTDYPEGVRGAMREELNQKLALVATQQFPLSRVILDPGFGFAKTPEQCVELMKDLSGWKDFHLPLLLGVSRKRFLQKYTGDNRPGERDLISAQLAVRAWREGFKIIRTHNVKLTKGLFDSIRK